MGSSGLAGGQSAPTDMPTILPTATYRKDYASATAATIHPAAIPPTYSLEHVRITTRTGAQKGEQQLAIEAVVACTPSGWPGASGIAEPSSLKIGSQRSGQSMRLEAFLWRP